MSVKEHYDSHLGNFYEWMVGDFEDKQATQEAYFRSKGIFGHGNKIAIDLGAGHGLQSISLANLGFEVKAIDFNQQLLQSLRSRSKGRAIEVIESDILSYLTQCRPADLIVCMGDTLAHLASFDDLKKMIEKVYEVLKPGAMFVSSFRDYQTELVGTQRFIPVKSDHSRILTCFLEYKNDKVLVTDLLYEKEEASWLQKASSYYKLRVDVEKVRNVMLQLGFNPHSYDQIQGMNYLLVQK